ncbi:hypothetical protein C9F11_08970 [Streptomyces sp. YIM 121038]|uniref:helix-turn-helix domain-containing protein n=1 Tax=Streptomyces sp. YIM 121038 TaxID=2136401 RepID=UPI001110C272|nr:helix-turn-helix domain-containing protein [Streptomyces sp. YIM 121038]QCX75483.1 hypothetical protein C9F11_08970 [Streptomyces sp. YIM 121038]
MSIQHITLVLDAGDLCAQEKAVLTAFCNYTNPAGQTFAGEARLAATAGMPERTFRTWRARLVERGLLVCRRKGRHVKTGGQLTSRTRVNLELLAKMRNPVFDRKFTDDDELIPLPEEGYRPSVASKGVTGRQQPQRQAVGSLNVRPWAASTSGRGRPVINRQGAVSGASSEANGSLRAPTTPAEPPLEAPARPERNQEEMKMISDVEPPAADEHSNGAKESRTLKSLRSPVTKIDVFSYCPHDWTSQAGQAWLHGAKKDLEELAAPINWARPQGEAAMDDSLFIEWQEDAHRQERGLLEMLATLSDPQGLDTTKRRVRGDRHSREREQAAGERERRAEEREAARMAKKAEEDRKYVRWLEGKQRAAQERGVPCECAEVMRRTHRECEACTKVLVA